MTDNEIWKPIPGFPGYDVSDHGRVRSYYARGGNGTGKKWHLSGTPQRNLSPSASRSEVGYLGIQLCANGNSRYTKIAPLVLLAFVGPCPDGMEVCHNDGDPKNNHLSNLRYDTHAANILDARKLGRMSDLDPKDILDIRNRRANGETCAAIADDYPVGDCAIHSISVGRTHRHVGGPLTTTYVVSRPRPVYKI